MAPPRVGWRGRSFAIRLPGATHNVPFSPLGLWGPHEERLYWDLLPGPCAQGPRMSSATCGGRCGSRAKRVPGVSQRLEVDVVSLTPGVSLYASSSWRTGRRRRGKRGGKACTELHESRGGGARGTLKGGENCGSEARRQSLPPPRASGAPPPRGTHPAAPNLENKGSGKHGRGRRAEVEGCRKAGWGQGRAPVCTSSPGRRTESSTPLAPRGGCFSI